MNKINVLSDSDEGTLNCNTNKSRRLVKKQQRRKQTLSHGQPVEIIDLCDISPGKNYVSSTPSINLVTPETKNYDSSDLFLSDPIIEPGNTRSRASTVKSLAARGRGTNRRKTRSSGRGRGRGKSHATESEIQFALSPPQINDEISEERNINDRNETDVTSCLTPDHPSTIKSGKKRERKRTASGPRNRGRGRSRSSKEHTNQYQSIPTFNIGNCDEYPDTLENIQLFANNDQESFTYDLDESLNNEMSVKVYWQNVEVVKFMIRRLQKISQIFDFFMERENVTLDQLLFIYNNNILQPDDTPDSIEYSIAKFIEGGIINTKVTSLCSAYSATKTVMDSFKLKFQCPIMKRPIEITIGEKDKLQLAMIKCAEQLEMPLSKLKFEFDGDILKGNVTPLEMDIGNGDCIDVKILKK